MSNMKLSRREKTFTLWFLTPGLIVLFIITFAPILYLIYQSLCKFDIFAGYVSRFAGFVNFKNIFDDSVFWHSLGITIKFVGTVVLTQLVVGFLLAILFNRESKILKISRTLLVLPMAVTPVVSALTWRIMFNPTFGLINYLMSLVGLQPHAWVADAKTALWALCLIDIWAWTPFMMLMFLAGLKSIPLQLFEAAEVDGASRFQTLRLITIPLLKEITIVAVLLRTIEAFKAFDIVYMLTRGGPGRATQTLNIFTFRKAFEWLDMGYASGMGVILLVMIILLCILIISLGRLRSLGGR